jgi:glutamine amidotransferase
MAHIRKATIGDIEVKNSHPFTEFDESGRQWVLMHNGTIFESDVLAPYQYTQEGMTDSERILLYIVDVMNKFYLEGGQLRDGSERIEVIDEIIRTITPGNKVNLMIYDGEYFYVHKNEAKSLYSCQDDGGVVFATKPLNDRDWEEIELNRLLVFKDGKLIYRGIKHDNTYEHSDERMKQLYLAYSQL